MPYPVTLAIVAVVAFLLGSIPFGVIVGRVGYHADPRDGGSGSIGMTNMARMFGVKAAVITFIGDVAKGALAVGFGRLMLAHTALGATWQTDLLLVLAVLCSIFGHVFCPWLGFKGGKGISTGLGSILVAFPPVALTILAVFLVVALATKRISAGSICAAIAFPIASAVIYWQHWTIIITALVVCIAVVFAHRGNVKRLLNGTEPKFSFGHASQDGDEDAPAEQEKGEAS